MTAIRSFSKRSQRGSTLTGIIIGLIIGLGIAVAVALMITKGASPFTERSNKMGRPADLEPSQATDPNKPLYGNRDAARDGVIQRVFGAAAFAVEDADHARAVIDHVAVARLITGGVIGVRKIQDFVRLGEDLLASPPPERAEVFFETGERAGAHKMRVEPFAPQVEVAAVAVLGGAVHPPVGPECGQRRLGDPGDVRGVVVVPRHRELGGSAEAGT